MAEFMIGVLIALAGIYIYRAFFPSVKYETIPECELKDVIYDIKPEGY